MRQSSLSVALKWALFGLTLQSLTLTTNKALASSYLDDYFLPTAKLALNKLQQSLSLPSTATATTTTTTTTTTSTSSSISSSNLHQQQQTNYTDPQESTTTSIPAATTTTVQSTQQTATRELPVSNAKQPDASRAVDGSSSSDLSNATVELEAGPSELPATSSEQTLVTSTEAAVEQDPTSGADTSLDRAASEAPATEVSTGSGSAASTTTTTESSTVSATSSSTAIAPETTSTQQQAAKSQPPTGSVTYDEGQARDVAVKSADDASVRETELEAVAAVDASIGFGSDLFNSLTDSCYDEYANAQFCEPEFENVAFERQVEVSSECGTPPSRFCTAYLNERNEQIRNCHICDAKHPKKRHPAAYLTDMNNSNQPTCWVSAPMLSASYYNQTSGSELDNQGNLSSTEQPLPVQRDNVTLTLNLNKKYEIVYISLQFCSLKPDSLAIYKSDNYGQTWTPYQFYSSQCRRMYGRQSRSIQSSSAAASGQMTGPEASCTSSSGGQQLAGAGSSGRIAFSPLDGRSSSASGQSPLDSSSGGQRSNQLMQNWTTATNIRIVLDRHQASWIHSTASNLLAHQAHSSSPGNSSTTTTSGSKQDSSNSPLGSQTEATGSGQLIQPSDTFNYAMSDLTVGGRCKCNGHASRCVHGRDGKLQCDCRHNTAGRDCEKCAPFHFDRPWARATQLDANPCQPCNCNGHSRKCHFDAELYRLSGRRSGGVCMDCRHNTAGRFCHYCKEGFTRDNSKPMSDKEACKHCDCHPIGSLGRACNQTTGQCPCKEGVSGLQCNRCAPGYQQSSSLTEPCIKLPDNENDINYYPPLTVDGDDKSASTSDQQPAGGSGEPIGPVDPSAEEAPSVAPKPRPPKSQLDEELAPSLGPQTPFDDRSATMDKDDDTNSEAGIGDELQAGANQRPSRLNQRPLPAGHWQHPSGHQFRGGKQHNYYGYHTQGSRHRVTQQQPAPHYESMGEADGDLDIGEDLGSGQADENQEEGGANLQLAVGRHSARPMQPPGEDHYSRNYYANQQHYGAKYNKQRYLGPADFRQQSARGSNRPMGSSQLYGASGRQRPPVELSSAALPVDEMSSVDEPNGPMYVSSNDDTFNQIQPTGQQSLLRRQHQIQMQMQMQNQMARGRHQGSSRRPHPPAELLQSTPIGGGSSQVNEAVCGDCQSGTRRLSSRQFCHLHYAIKATILNKYMAEDWTKFEVEVQDIFKSPVSQLEPVASGKQSAPAANVIGAENMLLMMADEPTGDNRTLQLNGGQLQPPAAGSGAIHRIKVGTVQSIWVPTEDLSCRCPRLKLRSTYLLMGSVDSKENSANALQLDRHGVALEWKVSSLQEKLMKYQRRLAKGKCAS